MRRSTHPVVGLQFVDLLFVHLHPKVLADELDDLERVRKAWTVLCVPFDQPHANLEADGLNLTAGVLQLRGGWRLSGGARRTECHLDQLHVQERERGLRHLRWSCGGHDGVARGAARCGVAARLDPTRSPLFTAANQPPRQRRPVQSISRGTLNYCPCIGRGG